MKERLSIYSITHNWTNCNAIESGREGILGNPTIDALFLVDHRHHHLLPNSLPIGRGLAVIAVSAMFIALENDLVYV